MGGDLTDVTVSLRTVHERRGTWSGVEGTPLASADIPGWAGALVMGLLVVASAFLVLVGPLLPIPMFWVGAVLFTAWLCFVLWLIPRVTLPDKDQTRQPPSAEDPFLVGEAPIPSATTGSALPAVKRRIEGTPGPPTNGDTLYRVPGPALFFGFLFNAVVIASVVAWLVMVSFPSASKYLYFGIFLAVAVLPFELWFAFSPRTRPRDRQLPRRRYRRTRKPMTRSDRTNAVVCAVTIGSAVMAGGIYLLTKAPDAQSGGMAATVIWYGSLMVAGGLRWLHLPVIDGPQSGAHRDTRARLDRLPPPPVPLPPHPPWADPTAVRSGSGEGIERTRGQR